MGKFWWLKIYIRHVNGNSLVLLGGTIALSVTMTTQKANPWLIGLVAVAGLALTLLAIQNHTRDAMEIRMLGFSREFSELKPARRKSAGYVLTGKNRQDDVDDVLDLFEDVGSALARNEISAERAHYYFYEWIQGYWEQWFEYIIAKQNGSSVWRHIFPLYEATKKIEGGNKLTEEKLKKFWEGEETTV